MRSKKDHFIEYYNKYVEHYNNSLGLSGYNELLTIKKGVSERCEVIKKQAKNIVSRLEDNLNRTSTRDGGQNKKRTKVLRSFFDRVLTNFINHLSSPKPEKNLEVLTKAVNEFYDIHNAKNAGESVVLVNDLWEATENYQHIHLHLKAIRSVTVTILQKDYPEIKLERYQQLSKSEQSDVNDYFLQNIKPDKDEIYLLYKEYKEDSKISEPFYRLIDNLEKLNLNHQEHYFKTDTPQNFDKAYRDWYEKMSKENPQFLKKRSQLPKVKK